MTNTNPSVRHIKDKINRLWNRVSRGQMECSSELGNRFTPSSYHEGFKDVRVIDFTTETVTSPCHCSSANVSSRVRFKNSLTESLHKQFHAMSLAVSDSRRLHEDVHASTRAQHRVQRGSFTTSAQRDPCGIQKRLNGGSH